MRQDDDSDCTDDNKSLHNLLSADPPPFSVPSLYALAESVPSFVASLIGLFVFSTYERIHFIIG